MFVANEQIHSVLTLLYLAVSDPVVEQGTMHQIPCISDSIDVLGASSASESAKRGTCKSMESHDYHQRYTSIQTPYFKFCWYVRDALLLY